MVLQDADLTLLACALFRIDAIDYYLVIIGAVPGDLASRLSVVAIATWPISISGYTAAAPRLQQLSWALTVDCE